MKTCPICRAVAFDDAAVCFGCLHEFTPDDEVGAGDGSSGEAVASDAPPAFLIQIKPERERSGRTSWTCTVDLMPA